MRLAFLGTPDFAAKCLGELVAAGHDIAVVYTRAPQRAGRGKKLRKSAVHELADALRIDVRTPKSFRDEEVLAAFSQERFDAAIVVAYGMILPQRALDAPRLGCFNLHASLLPRWRGAAPIQRAIMAGDDLTGVQVMQMEAGLDTGPILLSEACAIHDEDTAASLHDRLAQIGAHLLPRFLSALARGGVEPTPQSGEGICYAEKISSAEAQIDWSASAHQIDWKIRGLSPFPGAWFIASADGAQGQRVKALASRAVADSGAPGVVLQADEKLIIGCGEGAVELIRLQRAGKSAQPVLEFLRGFPLKVGDKI